MATDMFMVIDGGTGCKGESRDSVYSAKGGIDVQSWSWGLNQSGYGHLGGGSGSGKVAAQDLTFVKFLDTSTPYIMSHICHGKHFKDALLVCRKASGGKALEYLTIKMEQVMPTSYQTGHSGDGDKLLETISLNFAKVTVTYTDQKADGTPGKTVPLTYDFAKNIK